MILETIFVFVLWFSAVYFCRLFLAPYNPYFCLLGAKSINGGFLSTLLISKASDTYSKKEEHTGYKNKLSFYGIAVYAISAVCLILVIVFFKVHNVYK